MNGRPNALAPVAILGFLLAFALLTATTAHAAVTPCPAVPDSYSAADPATDTDAIVSELRELRRENAITCDAIRSGTVDTRDAVLSTDARAAVNASADETSDASDAIVSAIEDNAPTDGSEERPTVVSIANGDRIAEQAINAYNAGREVLWLIAGLTVALIVTPMLRRVIFP